MDRKLFCALMQAWKSLEEEFDSQREALGAALGVNSCGIWQDYYPANNIRMLLIDRMSDANNNWIDYFVFDKNWGTNKALHIYGKDDGEIPLNNFNDLYDLLISESDVLKNDYVRATQSLVNQLRLRGKNVTANKIEDLTDEIITKDLLTDTKISC